MDRYLEIMRRTGLPVIVTSGDGEPVVLMPLEAYEVLVGAGEGVSYPLGSKEGVAPESVPHTPEYSPEEETQDFPTKSTELSEKSTEKTPSVEDRFFLDPIE